MEDVYVNLTSHHPHCCTLLYQTVARDQQRPKRLINASLLELEGDGKYEGFALKTHVTFSAPCGTRLSTTGRHFPWRVGSGSALTYLSLTALLCPPYLITPLGTFPDTTDMECLRVRATVAESHMFIEIRVRWAGLEKFNQVSPSGGQGVGS